MISHADSRTKVLTAIQPFGSEVTFVINGTLHQKPWRKIPTTREDFLTTTFAIFESGQEAFTNIRGSKLDDLLLAISGKYQQAILKHARQLATATTTRDDHLEASIFSGIHSVWNLAHVIFLGSRKGHPILESLSSWIQLNHVDSLQRSFERTVKLVLPKSDPEFWPLVYRCILRGHFDAAISLLCCVEAYKADAKIPNTGIFTLTTLLKQMPFFSSYPSSLAFKNAWRTWKDEVAFSAEQFNLLQIAREDAQHFKTAFEILCGETDVILKAALSWHESLLGLLFFCEPNTEVRHLGPIIAKIEHTFSKNLLDQIQLAILQLDVALVLKHTTQFDWWLATHLIDIFEKGDVISTTMLKDINPNSECSLSEWYRFRFADQMLTESAFWKIGLDYLRHSGGLGAQVLRTVVTSISLDSDEKVSALLDFCDTHHLRDCKVAIQSVLGKRAFDNGEFDLSILYYADAKKMGMVSHIVEQILKEFVEGRIGNLDSVVVKIPSEYQHSSPPVSFLFRYKEFLAFKNGGELPKAGELLVSLLSSETAPKKFWPILLTDAVALLEHETLIFSLPDTMELMRCLEEWRTGMHVKSTGAYIEPPSAEMNVIMLALTRNLARSMMFR